MTAWKSLPDRPGLEWAAAQAGRVIHDNDVESLKQLLAEYPALLSWHGNEWDSKGACSESPRVPTLTRATRNENGGSPAQGARSC